MQRMQRTQRNIRSKCTAAYARHHFYLSLCFDCCVTCIPCAARCVVSYILSCVVSTQEPCVEWQRGFKAKLDIRRWWCWRHSTCLLAGRPVGQSAAVVALSCVVWHERSAPVRPCHTPTPLQTAHNSVDTVQYKTTQSIHTSRTRQRHNKFLMHCSVDISKEQRGSVLNSV